MAAPRHDAKEIARQAYFSLPAEGRSSEQVRAALKGAIDPIPSKGTITRWIADWRNTVADTAKDLVPGVATARPNEADLAHIPQVLRDALSPELLAIVPGKGLERCENAIVELADAIAAKAKPIADMLLDTESETTEVSKTEDGTESRKVVEKGKAATRAIAAMVQLANAMNTLTASRLMVSVGARNYAESDMLHSAGDKNRAEAEAVRKGARPAGAKDITGHGMVIDAEDTDEQEALAALRGVALDRDRKKPSG